MTDFAKLRELDQDAAVTHFENVCRAQNFRKRLWPEVCAVVEEGWAVYGQMSPALQREFRAWGESFAALVRRMEEEK